MISIYCFASINNLPGTFKNPKIGLINTVPIKIKIAETITPNTSAIAMIFELSFYHLLQISAL